MDFITDRTAVDVARAQQYRSRGWNNLTAAEKAEWLAGLKGAYNYTDLNRVESAVAAIRDRLVAEGYPVETEATRTWSATDVPTASDLGRYLRNVRTIREAFAVKRTTPQTPTSMSGLNYVGANAIEQILADVDQLLTNMISAYTFSSEIYGGESL